MQSWVTLSDPQLGVEPAPVQSGRWAKVSSDSIPGEWGPLPAGRSWHPARPQSSADRHHVTQPGKTVPDVGGRADWGLGTECAGQRAAEEGGPAASGSLQASQAGLPGSAAVGATPAGGGQPDPYLWAPEVQEGRCGLGPGVAAHREGGSGCSPFLSWPQFSCGDTALGLAVPGRDLGTAG